MKELDNELKIFIAGGKDLSEERSCIKVVANDLNSSTGVHVYAISYEDMDANQGIYDQYIEETADIVIFVIDKSLGALTEDEFIIAANSYRKEKHPEVIVFLRKFKKEDVTAEMAIERARIEGLIKGKFDNGKYYIDYTKDDDEKDHSNRLKDLKIQAKESISRYIDQRQNKNAPKTTNNSKSTTKPLSNSNLNKKVFIYKIVALIAAIAFFGILAWHFLSNTSERHNATVPPYGDPISVQKTDSLIVFAGGGSVRNYLSREFGDSLDVLKYPRSINIGLASGSSWRVLSEEYQYMSREDVNKFTTICLSASEILSESDFYKEHIGNMEDVIVGEVFLGYDALSVMISNDLLSHWGMENSANISTKVLANTIKKIIVAKPGKINDARIFTTNKTSGTLSAYQKSLSNCNPLINFEDLVDNNLKKLIDTIPNKKDDSVKVREELSTEIGSRGKICCIYYDKSAGSDITTGYDSNYKPYIILGSSYYFPENLDSTKYTKLLLVDDDGEPQLKPMYLYFLARGDKDHKDHYFVNARITEYLKLLNGKIEVDPEREVRWNDLLTNNRIYFQSDEDKSKIVRINKN